MPISLEISQPALSFSGRGEGWREHERLVLRKWDAHARFGKHALKPGVTVGNFTSFTIFPKAMSAHTVPGVHCRCIKTRRIDLGSLRLKEEPVGHSRDRIKWADSYFRGH